MILKLNYVFIDETSIQKQWLKEITVPYFNKKMNKILKVIILCTTKYVYRITTLLSVEATVRNCWKDFVC